MTDGGRNRPAALSARHPPDATPPIDAAMPLTHLADNPLGLLTFIVAPGILTNAASVSAMATSQRLARGTDRVRFLSTQLEGGRSQPRPWFEHHLKLLDYADRRVLLMVRALTAFYAAVGAFAAAALLSLVGAGMYAFGLTFAGSAVTAVSLSAGSLGVLSLVVGSGLIVFETRLTLRALTAETEFLLTHHRHHLIVDPSTDPDRPKPPGA